MLIQKIGRGLRRTVDKDKLEYHDFIFTFNPALQSHSEERMKVLEQQGHPVIVQPRPNDSVQEDLKDQLD
jgi:superfamily II DNA or RNA helicase